MSQSKEMKFWLKVRLLLFIFLDILRYFALAFIILSTAVVAAVFVHQARNQPAVEIATFSAGEVLVGIPTELEIDPTSFSGVGYLYTTSYNKHFLSSLNARNDVVFVFTQVSETVKSERGESRFVLYVEQAQIFTIKIFDKEYSWERIQHAFPPKEVVIPGGVSIKSFDPQFTDRHISLRQLR